MYSDSEAIARLDGLIKKADQVLSTDRPNPPGYIGFSTLSNGQFAEWQTQCLSFLINLLGTTHVYVTSFSNSVKEPYISQVEAGQGILRGLREDVQLGLLRNFRSLISADLFTDFLDMSSHLLDEGYKDAAAVMIGGALEGHLRQLCIKHSVDLETMKNNRPAPKKADLLNADLAKAGAYSTLDQKNVTAWLDLRNKAAHAQYNEYTKEQVSTLLMSVRDFITRVPA